MILSHDVRSGFIAFDDNNGKIATAFDLPIRWSPNCLRRPFQTSVLDADARLRLLTTLLSDQTWQHGIANLWNACPQFGGTRDKVTGLPAFLLAGFPDLVVVQRATKQLAAETFQQRLKSERWMTKRLMLTYCISPHSMKSCKLFQCIGMLFSIGNETLYFRCRISLRWCFWRRNKMCRV